MSFRGSRGGKGGPRRNVGQGGGNRSGGWNSEHRDSSSTSAARSVNASNWRASTPSTGSFNSLPSASDSTNVNVSSPAPKPASSTNTTTWAAIATAQPPRSSQGLETTPPITSSPTDTNKPPANLDTKSPPSVVAGSNSSTKPVFSPISSTSAWANGPPTSVKTRPNPPITSNVLASGHQGSSSLSISSSTSIQSSIVPTSNNSVEKLTVIDTCTIETVSPPLEQQHSTSASSTMPSTTFLTASTGGTSSSWAVDDADDVEPLPEWFTKATDPGTQVNDAHDIDSNTLTKLSDTQCTVSPPVTVTSTYSCSTSMSTAAGVSQKALQGFIYEATRRESTETAIHSTVRRGDSQSPANAVTADPFCAPEAAQVLARRVAMALEAAKSNGMENSQYQPPSHAPKPPSVGMMHDGKTNFLHELSKICAGGST